MERDILTREEVADQLRVCTKTVVGYIEKDGLPMAPIGRTSRTIKEDLITWIRSKYPQKFKDMVHNALETVKKIITRGTFESESLGIALLPDGTKQRVTGERFEVLKRFEYDENGWKLSKIIQQGTVRFETITKELQL